MTWLRRVGPSVAVMSVLALSFWPHQAWCQSFSVDLGQGGQTGTTSRLIQITAAMAVLSLAPSLLVMMTAFTRIVIVLSLLRSGIGAQGTPAQHRHHRAVAVPVFLRDAADVRESLERRPCCRWRGARSQTWMG